MKNTIRAMMLGASALAFVAAPAVSNRVFAQDAAAQSQCTSPEKDTIYNDQIRPNVSAKVSLQQNETAFNAAKQYLEKFRNCEDNKEIVAYLDKYVNETYPKRKNDADKAAVVAKFGEVLQAKPRVPADVFAAGKNLLATNPDNDTLVLLYLVDTGYEAASNKNDSFNADTMGYARQTIDKINQGKVVDYKTSPYKDKDEALAWMHYTMGYITAARQQNKAEGAPHFYKAIGFNSDIKNNYLPYLFIGQSYLDQFTKAAEDYNKIKDDAAVSEDDKNKSAGIWKAYADRAAEYFARAYTAAQANKKIKPEVSKDIYNTLTEVYKLRHDQQTTGIETFIANFNGKPATDPATAITPVVEATPTTAPAAISSSASSTEAANAGGRTTSAGTASGTGVGRASGSAMGSAAGTNAGTAAATTTTTKTTTKTTTAKKPAPRKKS